MKKLFLLYLVVTAIIIVSSCQKSSVNIIATHETPQLIPYDYFDKMHNDGFGPSFSSPVIRERINNKSNLGRVLFYDKKLSLNNSISCNSCHLQEFAFGDRFSKSFGFQDEITSRNSPTIQNLISSKAFFWDMSQSSLQNQVLIPFLNHIEMGIPNIEYLVEKVRSYPYYEPLFNDVYGHNPTNEIGSINEERISNALAQFIKSITTTNSKFDDQNQQALNAQETIGKELFLVSCNNCHQVIESNFIFNNDTIITSGNSIYTGGNPGGVINSANIGLDKVSLDQGAGDGRFKIPTLRNLLFSAPYMHDGRFETLDEVIEHYNSGVVATEHLDFRLRSNHPNSTVITAKRLHLDHIEKEALKAFLFSLTDTEFVTEEMYANPFKY